MNMLDQAVPADAVTIGGWTIDGPTPFRTFEGSSWRVPVAGDIEGYNIVARGAAEIPVEIRGVQFADGRVDRWVALGPVPEDLPLATARMLAESFAAAVAEADRFNACDDCTPEFSAVELRGRRSQSCSRPTSGRSRSTSHSARKLMFGGLPRQT